jgi:hypothetical protein
LSYNPNEIMTPGMQQLLEDHRAEIFANLNCVNIGKIESVKSSEQTVEVQLQIRRPAADGTSTLYPVLVDCPYFVLQGGGAYIDMPIKAGDYCLVLFNDRCIDTWWDSANVADPPSMRKHSLSDGIALVGINPKPNALAMDGSAVRILGTSGPGSEKEAARKGDEIKSTATEDPTFWTWIAAVGAVLTGLGVTAPVPSSLTGKITGGSSEVKIG